VKRLREAERSLSQFYFRPQKALQNLSYGGAEFFDILQEAVELVSFFFFYTPVSNPFSPVVFFLGVFQ